MESIFKVTGFYTNSCENKRHIIKNIAAFASTIEKAEEIITKDKCEKDLVYYRVEEFRIDKPSQFEVYACSERIYDKDGELLSITKGANRTTLKKRFYEGEHVAVSYCDREVLTGILLKKGKVFEVLTVDGPTYISMKNVFKREYNQYTEYEKIQLQKRLDKAIKEMEDEKLFDECQEKLKSLCHCYHGEEDCPEEYLDTVMEHIWAAEMLIIKNNIRIIEKVNQEWLDTQIIKYFDTWCWDEERRSLADYFFDLFPAPEYQEKVMKKVYQ